MENKENSIFDNLILKGALQMAGVDENTGEILYQFTPKLKEIMPDLYNEHLNYVNNELMRLWEMGFVNMDLFSDNPIVTLTHKALDQEAISKLSKEDRWAIEEIRRILSLGEL